MIVGWERLLHISGERKHEVREKLTSKEKKFWPVAGAYGEEK